MTAAELQGRVRRRAAEEPELALDPRFFEVTARELGVVLESADLKPGRADNEMTAYRYDAVLRRVNPTDDAVEPAASQPCGSPCSLDTLRSLLRGRPSSLRVPGVRNARLASAVAAADRTASATGVSLEQLKEAPPERGLEPEDIRELDPEYDGRDRVLTCRAGPDGSDLSSPEHAGGGDATLAGIGHGAGGGLRARSSQASRGGRRIRTGAP